MWLRHSRKLFPQGILKAFLHYLQALSVAVEKVNAFWSLHRSHNWWGSGRATPKYGTLGDWVLPAEVMWGMPGAEGLSGLPLKQDRKLSCEVPSFPRGKEHPHLQREWGREASEEQALRGCRRSAHTLSCLDFPWLSTLHLMAQHNTEV